MADKACDKCGQTGVKFRYEGGKTCQKCEGTAYRERVVAKRNTGSMICCACKAEKPASAFVKGNPKCKACRKVKCTVCEAEFATKQAVTRHSNEVHLKLKPFKCEYCDFTCSQKISLKVHACYAIGKKGENGERAAVKREEEAVQRKIEVETGGVMTKCPVGTIDILTEYEIIEIKHWHYWKTAIGQVIAYGHFYPHRAKRIHFFGKAPPDDHTKKVGDILAANGIEMTYE